MEPTAFLLQRMLIVTAVVLSVSASYAPARLGLCGKEIKTADVNGVKLSYFECGVGEPVVFVHGGFGSLHTWNGQVDEFAKEFRVISYSRRYHIPNAAPDVGETAPMQVHVEDLAALIRGLDTGPAHVVGHSYGALIAVALALQHPDLVRSMILGEPPVPSLLEYTSVGKSTFESFLLRAWNPAREASERGNMEEGVGLFLDGVGGTPGAFGQLPADVKKEIMKNAPAFRAELITDRSSYLPVVSCESLGSLDRPIFLLAGEKSPAYFLLMTAELERCLKGESFAMVPQASHGLQFDNPAFFNQTVLEFIRRQ